MCKLSQVADLIGSPQFSQGAVEDIMQWLINAANQCCAYASGSDGDRLRLKKVETVSAPFWKRRLQWLQPGYFSQCVEKLFCRFGTLCFHRGFFVKGKAKKKKPNL